MSLFEDDGFLEEAPALAVSSSSTPSVQRVITEKAVFTEWCIERNYVFDTTSRLRHLKIQVCILNSVLGIKGKGINVRIPDNTDGDDEDTRPRDKLEAMVFIFDFENILDLISSGRYCTKIYMKHLQIMSAISHVQFSIIDYKKSTDSDISDCNELLRNVERCRNVLHHLMSVVMHMNLSTIMSSDSIPSWVSLDTQEHTNFLYRELNPKKITPLEQFLDSILDMLQQLGYRRHGPNVVCEHILTTEDGVKVSTKFWKPVKGSVYSITQFLEEYVTTDAHPSLWAAMCHTGVKKNAISMLETCNESRFPCITEQLNRFTFSFSNGVFRFDKQQFYPYDSETGQPVLASFNDEVIEIFGQFPANIIACRFFDQEFDVSHVSTDYFDEYSEDIDDPRHWMNIPTTAIDKILDFQEISPSEKMWFYILFGRMFTETLTSDNWQTGFALVGAAGTGKTSLLNFLIRILPIGKSGTISNNVEEKFGLSTHSEAWATFFPELRINSLSLPLTDFLQMLSADPMTVAVKNKDPKQLPKWPSHVMMASNKQLSVAEQTNALTRRIVQLDFPNIIPKQEMDGELDKKMMMQVGNVLLKSAHAYYSAARSFGFKSIWCYLPEPFQVRNRRMEAACNPFAAFLSTQTEIKLLYPNGVKSENYDALSHTRPDCPYISLVHLQTLYNEFLMAEDITIKEKKINEELYRPYFKQYCIVVQGTEPGRPNVEGTFCLNISKKEKVGMIN